MNQPRQLLTAIAGALVIVVLAWFMFLYKPKSGEISEVETQVETAIAEEQSLRATLAQLESVDEDRPSEEAEVRRLSAAIPPDPELANFILAVHDIVGRSDLEFASISPALPAVVPGQAVSTIAVTMTVAGNFPNVLDFLDRLQDLDRIVVVDALALSSTEPDDDSGTATSSVANGNSTVGAGDAGASAAGAGYGSTPIEYGLDTGTATVSVRTDAASAGQVTPTGPTTTQPRAGALLLPREPAVQIVSRVISVAVTARLFTTAAPGGGGAATTTTTAPAGGTTTTVAG